MGRFAWGAFLGGVAGGITALMLAKKSGKEMREDLSKKYIQTRATSAKLLDELNTNKKDLVKRAKALANDAQYTAERILKDAQAEGRKSVREAKAKAKLKSSRSKKQKRD